VSSLVSPEELSTSAVFDFKGKSIMKTVCSRQYLGINPRKFFYMTDIFHQIMVAPVHLNQIGRGNHNPKIPRMEEEHQLRVHDIDLSVQGRETKSEIRDTRSFCLVHWSLILSQFFSPLKICSWYSYLLVRGVNNKKYSRLFGI